MSNYDYGTGNVNGKDIFDTHTTGASFYDDLIPGSPENKYMADAKNLKGEIKMVSPYEYFQGCAKIFNTRRSTDNISAENQIKFIKDYEQDKIEDLKKVITEKKKKFPLTYLNFAERGQEGRHRMYVAGELFGWKEKFPCLIINWADEDRHNRWVEEKRQSEIQQEFDKAIEDALRYRYDAFEDIAQELEWTLDRSKNRIEEYSDDSVVYNIEPQEDIILVTIKDDKGVEYKREIKKEDVRIEPSEETDDDIPDDLSSLSNDELDDMIKRLLKY